MTFIEFLDAHFIGLSLTVIAVVAMTWTGRVFLANSTTKTFTEITRR